MIYIPTVCRYSPDRIHAIFSATAAEVKAKPVDSIDLTIYKSTVVPDCRRDMIQESEEIVPWRELNAKVQKKFLMTKQEYLRHRDADVEWQQLVPVQVRLIHYLGHLAKKKRKRAAEVKTPTVYVVARDLCLLLGVRKGNVAKCLSDYSVVEKGYLRVHCKVIRQGESIVINKPMTILSLQGVKRLFQESKSPVVSVVQSWFNKQISLSEQEFAPPSSTAYKRKRIVVVAGTFLNK